MQAGKAADLRKAWGNKLCDHPTLEAEYYHGGDTGAYVCVMCGKMFNSDEAENLRNFRNSLEAIIKSRLTSLSAISKPVPHTDIDLIIQTQLLVVSGEMYAIGTFPGDYPVTEFDRAIPYHKLKDSSIDWLLASGVPARRHFAPLAADYGRLFGDYSRLPIPPQNTGRFFSLMLDWLQAECQIIIARQYYHRLGLYKRDSFQVIPFDMLPPEVAQAFRQGSLNTIEGLQLHGRIFLEYCAIMIRAQWDKLALLCCWAFGIDEGQDSIIKRLKTLADTVLVNEQYHPWCRDHLKVCLDVGQERLADTGWLRKFRDNLVHRVGEHSAGVVPRKKNKETTSELWDKVRDEHDWLREAMMAALVAFVSAKVPVGQSNATTQQAGQ